MYLKTKVGRDEFFDSNPFLKGKDIKGDTTVTVESFEKIMTRVSKKPRPCLRLKGYDMPLGLNVTNFDVMVEKFGDDTSAWVGKKILLKRVLVSNPQEGGKEQPGIRIA